MTTARSQLVDISLTRYYHCISRCVRKAFLCGEGFEHRKQWIEDRLELLAGQFAVSVAGFAVMDNHLHVLVRLDADDAKTWSDEEVVRRWLHVFPPKNMEFDDEEVVQMYVSHLAKDPKKVAVFRGRLADLGWFMKSLKEPLARMANREDGCKGTFWEGRYKSIAILDEEALMATCAYIDLNPVAAGMASVPERSKHTSVRQRVNHFRDKGKIDSLKAAKKGSIPASRAAGNAEQDHWLVPIEDRRSHTNSRTVSEREGMLEKFSLGSYLQLVDYTGRLFRQGKATISSNVKGIFDRLGTGVEFWSDRMKKMLSAKELRGRYFAGQRERLKEVSESRPVHHLANLSPQLG